MPTKENALTVDSAILGYRAAQHFNGDVFLVNHADACFAYEDMNATFERFGLLISSQADRQGNSNIGLLPFFMLIQRQAMAAFWSVASHQAYAAWVLLRPAVEATLIIGKWVDDPANARIWQNRQTDPKSYREQYEGKALVSRSLPNSAEIQKVLKRINDDFVHANPDFLNRHTKITPDAIEEEYHIKFFYFDPEPLEHRAHLLAFLNLIVTMQDGISQLLVARFNPALVPRPQVAAFQQKFGTQVAACIAQGPQWKSLLTDFGLWPH